MIRRRQRQQQQQCDIWSANRRESISVKWAVDRIIKQMEAAPAAQLKKKRERERSSIIGRRGKVRVPAETGIYGLVACVSLIGERMRRRCWTKALTHFTTLLNHSLHTRKHTPPAALHSSRTAFDISDNNHLGSAHLLMRRGLLLLLLLLYQSHAR